jgi:hypothetical protein
MSPDSRQVKEHTIESMWQFDEMTAKQQALHDGGVVADARE